MGSENKVRNPDMSLRLDQEKLERAEIRFMFWIIQYPKKHPEVLFESSEGLEIELWNLKAKVQSTCQVELVGGAVSQPRPL